MTRRSRWVFDLWSPDDPAQVRMRDGLALEPIRDVEEIYQIPPDAQPEPEPEPTAPPEARPPDRVSQLVQRVRDGDLGAIDALRRLLDR